MNNITTMKVLSLFDGISCARVALERAGIPVTVYFASEIDEYAEIISYQNYPDIIRLGDVKGIVPGLAGHCGDGIPKYLTSIDLLIGGSPCQDLSIAKKNRKGLDGERSGLFWEYVRILNEVKPKYFILENVNSMPKEAKEMISKTLGVEPIMINASLVSAQNRKRLFWIGKRVDLKPFMNKTEDSIVYSVYTTTTYKYEKVEIPQPEDRRILLKDILEVGIGEPVALRNRGAGKKPEYNGTGKANALTTVQTDSMVDTVYQYRRTYWRETKGGKVPTLTANMGTGGHNVPFIQQTARGYNKGGKKFNKVPTLTKNAWEQNHKLNNIRKLTPIECERLQGLPDNYTEGISNTQRYKCLGNAFNVDVVVHILKHIPTCST